MRLLSCRINRINIVVCFTFLMFNEIKAQNSIIDNASEVRIQTRKLDLHIQKSPWHMQLQNKVGKVLYEEAASPAFFVSSQWNSLSSVKKVKKNGGKVQLDVNLGASESAKAYIEIVNDNSFRIKIQPLNTASSLKLYNKLSDKEEVFGFGEMWNGSVHQRGKAIDLFDQNGTPDECAYIPVYATTNNYSFFLDYGGRMHADVGKTEAGKLILEAPTSKASILLSGGKSIGEAVSSYLKVTGLPVLPPRWTFKPWFWLITPYNQPKGRGYTAEDILTAARMYKDLDIPAAVTWMEPAWQSAGNSFEPSQKFSGDFKGFVEQLHQMGLKVLCWSTPYTQPNSPNFKEAFANNYFAKNTVSEAPKPKPADGAKDPDFANHYIDYTNPAARMWWQTQIKKVLDLGIDGFKLDAGQDLPEDGVLYAGAGKDYHNSFARYYNQTYFEILDKVKKDNFLTIPRSAWSGSNKYSVFKWPGDLMASFAENGLPSSIYSSISIGFSGFPFVSTDIGGFSSRPTSEEVWVRWSQFGALLPGMQTLNMPWWFSKKASDYYRYLSWLHTDLLPFWMTLAHEAHNTGLPIIRHLVFSFQEDEKARVVDDEYTIGESLLVAPVMTAENSRKVYLPEGNWFSFWDNKKVEGKTEVNWSGDLYTFPLYVREGAIIPMQVENDVTGFGNHKSKGYTTLAVWPKSSGQSQFILRDEGPAVKFNVKKSNGVLNINWSSSPEKFIFKINMEGQVAGAFKVKGDRLFVRSTSKENFSNATNECWYYDIKSHQLWVKCIGNRGVNTLYISK